MRISLGMSAVFFLVSIVQASDSVLNKLHLAALEGNIPHMRQILDKKEEQIEAKHADHGFTTLHIATILGRKDVVEFLIERNADVHAVNKYGQSVLIVALLAKSFRLDSTPARCRSGVEASYNELIRYLLLVSSKLAHHPDNRGNTPSVYALEIKDLDIVSLLLEH